MKLLWEDAGVAGWSYWGECDAGNELEIIHLNAIGNSLAVLVYDLAPGLIEGEAAKSQDWLSHIPYEQRSEQGRHH